MSFLLDIIEIALSVMIIVYLIKIEKDRKGDK